MIFGREPVAIASAIRAVLLAGVLFGMDLTDEQLVGVIVALEAVLTLLARRKVTPA